MGEYWGSPIAVAKFVDPVARNAKQAGKLPSPIALEAKFVGETIEGNVR
jgi:hypothetical protein